ncbi:Signal recognition particle receptor FtsY, partial [Haemophilus influenzae]
MAEENKKGGFWASLFGRNKKQDEPKIEPKIEEEKIKDVEPSVEKFDANDLAEEEKIQEISTALKPVALEQVEEIIEAKNLEDDLQPVVEIET